VDPNVTVAEYAQRWLRLCARLKPISIAGYRGKLDRHLLPALGGLKVRKLHRSMVKDLLAEKVREGLSLDSVRLVHATLRAMLNAAVDDGVIAANPAAGLGRAMRLQIPLGARSESVRALDREQLERFLAAALAKAPRFFPMFFLMSRTGLRLGEALALQWGDLDLVRRELRVMRALAMVGRRTDTPKSGHGRTVDLSASVCDTLRALKARASEAALARGEPLGSFVFPPATGQDGPMRHLTVETAFRRCVKAAGLPDHFTPHSLRHSYASLLLQAGVSPAYVQEQLGHASIELTVGTYGRWLRKKAEGAVDQLDEPADGGAATESGSRLPLVVAAGAGPSDGKSLPLKKLAEKACDEGEGYAILATCPSWSALPRT
jgi:integrase